MLFSGMLEGMGTQSFKCVLATVLLLANLQISRADQFTWHHPIPVGQGGLSAIQKIGDLFIAAGGTFLVSTNRETWTHVPPPTVEGSGEAGWIGNVINTPNGLIGLADTKAWLTADGKTWTMLGCQHQSTKSL